MDFLSFFTTHHYGRYERDDFDRYVGKKKIVLKAPVIHIAGTTGKSMTASVLEHMYAENGTHIACFYSSFLYSPCESIRVDGEEISEETLAGYWKDLERDAEKFNLSGFECLFLMAVRYFNETKAELAILECGMGGAIDATNLEDLDTRLSIITNIGLEHTSYLGTTTSQIAYQCSGILKKDNPLIVGPIDEAAEETIKAEARSLNCSYNVPDQYHFQHLVGTFFHFDFGSYKDLILNSISEYQLRNVAMALSAARLLQESFPLSEEGIRKGLALPMLLCRGERIGSVVLDGAENILSVNAVTRCARTYSQGKPLHVLFASLMDKNIATELPLLANASKDVTLTTFDHPLAKVEMDYFLYIADHPFQPSYEEALKSLMETYPEDAILVTGSMDFVAQVRAYLVKKNG